MDVQELELCWRTTLGSVPAEDASPLATYRPQLAPTVLEAPPAAPRAGPAAPTLGHFETLAELARGGMGVVHRARQKSLDREIAVKRMLGQAPGQAVEDRFVAEALVTGQLAHPNIVPVHELGRTDSGELFLAMKLVTGASWHQELLKGGARDLPAQLGTLGAVCQAVAFAHSRSVLHRDLKPANVMLGEFGEVLVMDWGLAATFGPRAEGSPVPHTADTTSPLGTPAYMPPELAEGRGADQGAWTDVYLLGAILHELLTGRPPHARPSFMATLAAASESRPPVFDASVPVELQRICARALAREPQGRFPSVVAFREALESYLGHRESVAIATAARSSLASGAEAGTPANQSYSRLQEAIAGFRQARTLWAENEEARSGEASAHRALAERALAQGDLALAETHAAALEAAAAKPILDAVAARRAREARSRRIFRGLQVGLAAAVVLLLASLSFGLKSTQDARRRDRVEAWEARLRATRLEVERLWDRKGAVAQERSKEPAQRLLVETAAVASQISALDVAAGELGIRDRDLSALRGSVDLLLSRMLEDHLALCPRRLGAGALYIAAAFSPDGRLIAAGGLGEFALWDRATGRPVRELEGVTYVNALAFSPDGRALAAGDSEGTVFVFEVATGRERYRVKLDRDISSCAFSPDGRELLASSYDRTVRLFDAATGARRLTLESARGPVMAAGYTPSGREVVSGASDGSVTVWDAATGTARITIEAHAAELHDLVVSSDGRAALTGSFDGTLGIWDLSSGKRTATFSPPPGGESRVAFCALAPDGGIVLGTTYRGALHAWDRSSGKLLWKREGASCPPAFSPDGREVVVGLGAGDLEVLDAATGKRRMGLDLLRAEVSASAVAPGGKALATGSVDGTVRLWDVARGATVWRSPGHAKPVSALAFGPGDREVLSGAADGSVRLWDCATGALLVALEVGDDPVGALAIAPDGQAFAVAAGKHVRLVALPSGKVLRSLGRLPSAPFFVSFSSSRHQLVVVDAGEILFYDLSTPGERPRRVGGAPGSPLGTAALFPDRDEMFVGSSHMINDWTFGSRLSLRGVPVPGESALRRCALAPDGQTAAALLENGKVRRFWAGDPAVETLQSCDLPDDGLDCGFVAGGDIVVVGRSGWIAVVRRPFGTFDVASKNEKRPLSETDLLLFRGVFSPDGDRALVGERGDGPNSVVRIALRDAATGRTLRTFEDGGLAADVAFERGGRSALAALSDDRGARLGFWDPVETAPLTTLAFFPKEFVMSLAVSPRGDRVAVGFQSGGLRVLDRRTGATLGEANGNHALLPWCGFSPDGSLVHAVWMDGTFETRSSETLARVRSGRLGAFQTSSNGFSDPRRFALSSFALSPDGSELLVGAQPTSFLYRLDPFELMAPLDGHQGPVVLSAFLGTKELVTGTHMPEASLRIWDRATGRLVRQAHAQALVAMFSPRDPRAPIPGVTLRGNIVHITPPIPEDPLVLAPELRGDPEQALATLLWRVHEHGTLTHRAPEEVPAFWPETAAVASLVPLAPERYEERGLALLLARGVDPGGAAAGIAWLRSAAASGSTRAMTRLSWALKRGLGARKPDEAKQLREKAKELGDPLAAGDLETAASRGDPLARVLLAVKTKDRAALERAASENEPDALVALAGLDPSRARELLERAVALGDPRAALAAADLEMARDPARAIELYERAGKLGERGAWSVLARIFGEGKVVVADAKRARAYRKLAEADDDDDE